LKDLYENTRISKKIKGALCCPLMDEVASFAASSIW
jgi:hypothetical protein